jgi:hypothetical protein
MKELLESSAGEIPFDKSLSRKERNRILSSPKTKEVLFMSAMLLRAFGNQIAAQVDPIEQADPPAIAQIQKASDQENLSDDEKIVAKEEETPLTPEEIVAQEVSEYPFVKVAPAPADTYDTKKTQNENIILELKRGNGVDQEDEAV